MCVVCPVKSDVDVTAIGLLHVRMYAGGKLQAVKTSTTKSFVCYKTVL